MKHYLPLQTIEVIGDNFPQNLINKKLFLYKDEPFAVFFKQKDMFDETIEYWTTSCGWTLKIEKSNLEYLIETIL